MPERLDAPAGIEPRAAAGCAAAAVAMLVLVPALARVEPGVADGAPATNSAAWWAVLTILIGQAVALAWRRQGPEIVAIVVATAVPLAAAAGIGAVIGASSLAVVVAVYNLATLRSPRRNWPLFTLAGVLVASGHTAAASRQNAGITEALGAGVVQPVVLLGAPLLVAALVLTRQESRTARADRVQALEREYAALVQAAVARERAAMARELHDIAAHHLTGIAVMSAAIAGQIDTDPAGAKAAVGDVRRESTAVLRDLRSLVGLLRDHDAAASEDGVRVATLAALPGLIEDVSAAGQDVGMTVLRPQGDDRPLGAGVGPLAQLAAYRMVQEALANAGRHAVAAHCEVEIDDRDHKALIITVRNAPGPLPPDPGTHGGLGLVGMKERAELTGSHLEVGPTPDGGWQVRLRTPKTAEDESGASA